MRCRGADACRTSDAARPRRGSLSSLPPPPPPRSFPSPPASPLRSLSSLSTSPLRSLSSLPAPPLRSLSSLPASPLRYALIRTGTVVVCSASQGAKEASDENHNFHHRRSFPRRHSGSCYVSEVICAWASSCEGSRSLVYRAWPHEGPAHECAHVRTGSSETLKTGVLAWRTALVAHDKAGVQFFGRPGRREAAGAQPTINAVCIGRLV